MRNIKEITKKVSSLKWQRVGKWVGNLPLLQEIIQAGSERDFLTQYGYATGFNNIWFTDESELMLTEKDLKATKNYFLQRIKKEGEGFFYKYRDNNLNDIKVMFGVCQKLKSQEVKLKTAENQTLKNLFREFVDATKKVMSSGYTMFSIQKLLEEDLRVKIVDALKKIKPKIDFAAVLANLTPPRGQSFVSREEEELLRIARDIAQDKKTLQFFKRESVKKVKNQLGNLNRAIEGELLKHWDKFCWMNSINWSPPLYSLNYYIERLKNLVKMDPKKQLLKTLRERQKTEDRVEKLIQTLKFSESVVQWVNIVRDYIELKMYRFDAVSIIGYRARPLLREIGKRNNLSYKDILHLITAEVFDLLDGKKLSTSLIKERKKSFIFLRLGKQIYVLSGEKMELFKNYLKRVERDYSRVREFKGSIAFQGKAKGQARIIIDVSGITKIKNGEILVAPMTNPDYMPAISKASAIVTDEGGILCHAAIISREYRIPCIIGTKIATKALKDGDLVEVNANKGIVKILK